MPSLTRSMFGVTGMNVVKVEKTRPCLRSGCLRSGRVQSICSRLKDQWRRYAVLKDLKKDPFFREIRNAGAAPSVSKCPPPRYSSMGSLSLLPEGVLHTLQCAE